jgi:hypothetical protein
MFFLPGGFWKTQALSAIMDPWSLAKSNLLGDKQFGFSDYEITTAKNRPNAR